MNRTSRVFMLIGIVVQVLTVVAFLLRVRPVTGMATVCLCFILFAELEFFGVMAALAQFMREKLSVLARVGFSAVSGAYTCLSIMLSLAFLPYSGDQALRQLWTLQILLLAVALAIEFTLFLITRKKRSAKNQETA